MKLENRFDNIYTPKEVAPILRLHVNSIYELVATGELRAIRVGKKILISETAISEFINGTK